MVPQQSPFNALNVRRNGVVLHAAYVGADGHFFAKRVQTQLELDVSRLTRAQGDHLRGRFEALKVRDDRTGSDRNIGESKLAALVRHLYLRSAAGTREGERHARQKQRLTVRSRD